MEHLVTLPKMSIVTLGTRKFSLEGEVHQVVTFLNKTLKRRNLIFGLTRSADGIYELRIYEVRREDEPECPQKEESL